MMSCFADVRRQDIDQNVDADVDTVRTP